MRSGAPSTASEATEPANMPNSNPRSAAMRAETASCTEAGCTHAAPARIPRKRVRRVLQRDGMSFSLWQQAFSGHAACAPRRLGAHATAGHEEHGSLSSSSLVLHRRSGILRAADAYAPERLHQLMLAHAFARPNH